ncbi:carboxymuconolactone decarboxylase family protein [Bacillus tianshenii]|nr:carboxymuconolactone decarboxylase family protein [Bacillus tianshenii]
MTNEVLYKKSNLEPLDEFMELAPEIFQAFVSFNELSLTEGVLSAKFKECIAIAIAHITGCPYCIELHVNQFKKKGGTKEEMSEAIMVATSLKAGSALAHGVNALNSYDDTEREILYKQSYFDRLKEFADLNKPPFSSFVQFDQLSIKPGSLSTKEKELIAVASAHTTGCPYCIDLHTKRAKKFGATKEEIGEAVFVSTALKAGSALAHGVNALQSYDS